MSITQLDQTLWLVACLVFLGTAYIPFVEVKGKPDPYYPALLLTFIIQ